MLSALQNNQYQSRLALQLLTPSLTSSMVVFAIALLGLAVPAWSFLEDSQALYEFFYGPQGLVAALQVSPEDGFALGDTIASLPATYTVTIVAFAAIVGTVVFAGLQIVNRFVEGMHALQAVRFLKPSFRKSVVKDVEIRFIFRAVIALLWLIFWFVTSAIVWPFCILCIRTGIGAFPTAQSWWYFALGFGLLAVALHLHVIFLRLMALRPRLFSTSEAIYR